MAIRLTWDDKNLLPHQVEIYRTVSPLNKNSLPAPIAVITDGSKSYVDDAAILGATYYYTLATVSGANRVFSTERKIVVEHSRGVGPNQLLWGDERYGYYGKLTQADFITHADIINVARAAVPSTFVTPNWHKFIRNNKIIYVPDRPFGSANWLSLYNAGFVFGVEGPGPARLIGGLTPVEQYNPVRFRGNNYVPRLMRGYWDTLEDAANGTFLSSVTAGYYSNLYPFAFTSVTDHDKMGDVPPNEYDDFIPPLLYWMTLRSRGCSISEMLASVYLGNTLAEQNSALLNARLAEANTRRIQCQERTQDGTAASSYVLCRGQASWSIMTTPSESSPLRASTAAITYYPGNHASLPRWVPVVELDERTVLDLT